MVMVTCKAKDELKKLLTLHRHDPNDGLRLMYKGIGQLGFVLGEERNGDRVIMHEGLKILLINRELETLLAETVLTVNDTNGKREFVICKSQNIKQIKEEQNETW